jgi:DNA polymerase-1
MIALNGYDFYEKYWRPFEHKVCLMENKGIQVDVALCNQKQQDCVIELDSLMSKLTSWLPAEMNVNSPLQVSKFLYNTKKLPKPPVAGTLKAVHRASSISAATSEAALTWLSKNTGKEDSEALKSLLKYKKRLKIKQFYEQLVKYVDRDNRIHSQFSPSTETGRLASKNPNLQNQPAEVRDVFVAKPGHKLVVLDEASLEWRILAHILAFKYQDYSLVNDIKAGINPHSAAAVRMGLVAPPIEDIKENYRWAYDIAKTLNYAINYGKTAEGLGIQLRDKNDTPVGTEKATEYLETFYRVNPGIKRFHEDIVAFAQSHGYVRSLLGRYRYIPDIDAILYSRRKKGERQAKNVIQNCAADILVMAMNQIEDIPVLQVHDELVFEVAAENIDECIHRYSYAMRNPFEGTREFLCPLDVDYGVGKNWKEAGGKG